MTTKRGASSKESGATVKTARPKTRAVTFSLNAPEAHDVAIAGDFNDWGQRAKPLKQDQNGDWRVTLRLAPGVYQYKFLVDGARWQEDPANPRRTPNLHGTYNSVCEVP